MFRETVPDDSDVEAPFAEFHGCPPPLRLGVCGSAYAPPASPGGAQPPDVFWCILSIK